MEVFRLILLGFLVVCAISVSLSKNLLNSILIYMSYSMRMEGFCPDILAAKDRGRAGETAPPQGLRLVKSLCQQSAIFPLQGR